jgi:peptidoglycan hydrolase-like protein with peptidoglycan-binding domain
VAADVSSDSQPADSTDTGSTDTTETGNADATDTGTSDTGTGSPDTSDTDTAGSDTSDTDSSGSDSTNADNEDRAISVRMKGSVGKGGTNRPSDVRIIQRLLAQLSDGDGGTASLAINGMCGPETVNAIRKFQRKNELNESGLFRPEQGSVLILYIKANIATLTYSQQLKKQKMKPAVLS